MRKYVVLDCAHVNGADASAVDAPPRSPVVETCSERRSRVYVVGAARGCERGGATPRTGDARARGRRLDDGKRSLFSREVHARFPISSLFFSSLSDKRRRDGPAMYISGAHADILAALGRRVESKQLVAHSRRDSHNALLFLGTSIWRLARGLRAWGARASHFERDTRKLCSKLKSQALS